MDNHNVTGFLHADNEETPTDGDGPEAGPPLRRVFLYFHVVRLRIVRPA